MNRSQIIARSNAARPMLSSKPMRNSHLKAKNRRRSRKQPALMRQYLRFFAPNPHLSQLDESDFYFDQPSPLKWVPSETTDGTMMPLLNG
jgi:hypothetical protein